jgi:hypothetical protein
MKHTALLFFFLGGVASGVSAQGQTQWELVAHWGSSDAHPDQIQIDVMKKGKNKDYAVTEPRAFVMSRSPAFTTPATQFNVTDAKGSESKAIKVVGISPDTGSSPPNYASSFRLSLEKQPEKGHVYTLSWKEGTMKMETPAGVSVTNLAGPLTVQGDIEIHNAFAHPHPKNDLSLKQGDSFGTWTFHYFQDWSSIEVRNDGTADPVRRFNTLERDIHFNLKSDGSFQSAKKGDFLDRVEAELGGYLEDVIYKDKPSALGWGIVEFGASTKMQADQQFKKIDETVGANAYFLLHNSVFDSIVETLCWHGDSLGKAPFLAPLITFGYDYVIHVRKDGSTAEAGQNRLTAGFYWDLPVLSKVDLQGIPLLEKISGLDLVIDLSGIYDMDKSKFSPEVNLSLDFVLSTSEQAPKISFSWVNGKTAPKFEHFDAFLAGMKWKF